MCQRTYWANKIYNTGVKVVSFGFCHSFFEGFAIALLFGFSLFLSLLLQEFFFQSAFLFSGLLGCFHDLLSFLFVLFELLRIALYFFEVFLEVFKQFNNLILDIVLDPFFHLLGNFVLLSCFDFFNDDIIKVIVDDFSDFVAAFAVVFGLVFA